MGFEIERKWILTRLPKDLKNVKPTIIEQSYLSVNDFSETRVRKVVYPNEDILYKLSVKDITSNTSKRVEIDVTISEEEYDQLTRDLNKKYKPIIKKYFRCIYGRHHLIEVSQVDSDQDGSFVYAEVEFNSEEEAEDFTFPWVGIVDKEVTGEPYYYMSSYWKRTRLDN